MLNACNFRSRRYLRDNLPGCKESHFRILLRKRTSKWVLPLLFIYIVAQILLRLMLQRQYKEQQRTNDSFLNYIQVHTS